MNKKYMVAIACVGVAIAGLVAMQRIRGMAGGAFASRSYSVADYIAERGQPQIVNGALDLSNKNITSLVGLERIPGIATVRRLNLSDNHIATIPLGILPNGLQELYLAHNNINNVQAGMFPTGLQELVLSHNHISVLSSGTFPAGLQELNLAHNDIYGSEENLDVFAQLGNVQIYLMANPITQEMTQQQFQAQIPNVQIGSW